MSALAADTTSPPAIGGWGVLAAVVLLVVMSRKRTAATTIPTNRRGFIRSLISAYRAVVGVLRAVWAVLRFYGGREMRGGPKSTATFFRAGAPATRPAVAPVSMASVAAPPARVSLVKPKRRQPSPWARRTASWIEGYRGKGAGALDRAVRTALWLARAAGKVWRFLKAVWRVLRAVYGVVAPVVTTLVRAARSWHCWPYSLRGLARLWATCVLVGLALPAWRTATVVGLVLTLAGAVAAGHLYRPKPPGDDEVYGPRIWAILRGDLGLPDDEPRENWMLLPAKLSAPDARIVIRLPWTWRGADHDREVLSSLINSRLPGEWVARVSLTGETFTAVYTHKPPPKPPAPAPECPDVVDFFAPDIQEAIAECQRGEVVLGKDQYGNIVKRRFAGETPHWALSVGSGGGKSTFNLSVAVQLIAQGFHIVVADVKRSSVKPLEGIPGVHIYNDPSNAQDMREAIEWFKAEIDARSFVKNQDPSITFPGFLLLIEEANEFADVSREWWDDNRKTSKDEFGPADRAADPIWGEVASAARLARFVDGSILAVFQDLRDQALGGKGLRNLFRLKFMGNFNVNQWKNVIGTTPVPDSIDKAGRMMIVEGNSHLWVQAPYGEDGELHDWAMAHREGFDPAAGLYGTPPERSAERLPSLLRGLSRDAVPSGPNGAPEGGAGDKTAGGVSQEEGSVTAQEGDVTASRDRLRLIPGQGGQGASQDLTAPPELLALAEISRRLGPDQGVPKYDTLRQHKARRDDFPKGVEIGGKEHYTESQILAYYAAQEKEA
ncbi:hypothetical protein [Streptomyces sp. NPDC005732]|uniref:hypothetical protein n=1 Tax=Streptomyces sp. NPDC005732 TaxID=3157057 RepID=UPI0033DDBB40